MPINDIRLAYIEQNEEQSQTVFFIHGNSGSSRTWKKQFQSAVFSNYRLIAFDLPGTGQSVINNIENWDNSPIETGRFLSEAVHQLSNNKPYCLVGFSYGTNVVAEMLQYSLKASGIVLSAACVTGGPYTLDKIFKPGDSIFFHDHLDETVVRNFFENSIRSSLEEDITINIEDYFQAKPPFRSLLIQSVMAGKLSDEISILRNQKIPILVLFGKDDNVLQIDYLDNPPFKVWNNQIFKLPRAGHFLHLDVPTAFNQTVSAYLIEIFKKTSE